MYAFGLSELHAEHTFIELTSFSKVEHSRSPITAALQHNDILLLWVGDSVVLILFPQLKNHRHYPVN